VIGAERSHEVDVPRAAHRGRFRAERFRDLHGERPHSSRSAVDQNLLPGLKLPFVAKTLECGDRRGRHGRRLFKRHVHGLQRDGCRASARVLREGAAPRTEHLVTRLKLGHVPADRFDRSREVATDQAGFRLAEPHLCASDVQAGQPVPIATGN
jgi:hypothetical protein